MGFSTMAAALCSRIPGVWASGMLKRTCPHSALRLSSCSKSSKHCVVRRSSICSNAASEAKNERTLVLYSKPGCCLCDGLKEKLQAAFMLGGENSLADVHLEVRDITTNRAWEMAYQYEIPVLARIKDDGSEEVLPRMSLRISVEQLQKKMAAILS